MVAGGGGVRRGTDDKIHWPRCIHSFTPTPTPTLNLTSANIDTDTDYFVWLFLLPVLGQLNRLWSIELPTT
jgi:hypothetical protein